MKKVAMFLVSLALLLSLSLPGYAREIPDPSRPGSLTFVMQWKDRPLNSGSLTLYRVGAIANDGGDYFFVLIPELQDSGLSLENLESASLPGQLEELAVEHGLTPISAPIRSGEAAFTDLLPGLYVVSQTEGDACDGFMPIHPFLISLPHWDGSAYVYDRTAQPKVSLEEKPTEPSEPPETVPPDSKLPQTGQLNWPVPVLAVSGLAFLLAGWFLCFGKKERHEK